MMMDYALLAQTPGVHASRLLRTFESYLNRPENRKSRRSSFSSEIALLGGKMCYLYGKVMDPYDGILSTGIECLT